MSLDEAIGQLESSLQKSGLAPSPMIRPFPGISLARRRLSYTSKSGPSNIFLGDSEQLFYALLHLMLMLFCCAVLGN